MTDAPPLSPEESRFAAGDAVLKDLIAAPVDLKGGPRPRVPFVFASPHSGRLYPESFIAASRLDSLNLRKSEDAFVDELFEGAEGLGAPFLAARFPRVFVDVNRGPGELDPAMFSGSLGVPVGPKTPRVAAGLGVIPRVVRDGMEIYRVRLDPGEAAFRLNYFYRPYHTALAGLIAAAKAEFGVAIVIDCHSMPAPSRNVGIVLGDCYGDSAAPELSGFVHRLLQRMGFSLARNAPYAGGYTTRLYGRPEADVHALQIEISRTLYLDEAAIRKTAAFAELKERMGRFTAELVGAAGPWRLPRKPAATAAE
jgi:N-formylglutamate amidohydrolase